MRNFIILFIFLVSSINNMDANSIIATEWAGGTGTAEDPYQISDISHLRKLAYDVNRGVSFKNLFIVMTNDITDNEGVLNYDGTLSADNESFNEWIQIGRASDISFKGNFDGQGHIISGICIKGDIANMSSEFANKAHLFGYIDNAIIKNIHIKDSYLCSIIGTAYTGSNVENCVNYGTTWCGFVDVGNKGDITIKGCGNYGLSYCAGIANKVNYGKVIDCYNMGKIIEKEILSSGLVNYVKLCVNCVNYGEVSNSKKAAGISYSLSGKSDKDIVGINLVNFGNIDPFDEKSSGAIACVVGINSKSYSIENAYALETSHRQLYANSSKVRELGDQERMGEAEMKSQSFLDKLNSNVDKINNSRKLNCCHWIFGKDGFPVLEIIQQNLQNGIENIQEDDSSGVPVIYNLQGHRVTNPTKGIYIMIKNGRTKKICISGE